MEASKNKQDMMVHTQAAIVGMGMEDMVIDVPFMDKCNMFPPGIEAIYNVRSIQYVSATRSLIYDVDGVNTIDPSYEMVGISGAILFQKMTEMHEAMKALNV